MSFNSSLFCSRLHFRWITKSSFRASVQTGGCRVLSECIYVFLYIPSVGLMRHHLHIWLFYLNKLWNRFCLVLRGKKPLGFCLFYCNVPECISKMESLRDWGCMCVCMVFKEEGQTSNITPASKSRYHLQMCDGLYIYDLTAIKKKLKTNLFIERFTASSQPCNFLKKIFSFFLFSWQNICCGWALMRTLWPCSLHAVPLFGLPEQYQYLLILYKNAFTLASFVESHMTVWSRTDKHKRTTTTKMTVGPVKMEHNWRIRGCNNFILPR